MNKQKIVFALSMLALPFISAAKNIDTQTIDVKMWFPPFEWNLIWHIH